MKSSFHVKPSKSGKYKLWTIDKGLKLQENDRFFAIHMHRYMKFGQLNMILQSMADMYPCRDYQVHVDYGEGIRAEDQIQSNSTIELAKPMAKSPEPVWSDFYTKLNRILSTIYQVMRVVKSPIYWFKGRFITKGEYERFILPIRELQIEPLNFLEFAPIEFELSKFKNTSYVHHVPENAVGWSKLQLSSALGYDPRRKDIDMTILYNEYIRRNLEILTNVQKGSIVPQGECYMARSGIQDTRGKDPRDFIYFVVVEGEASKALSTGNFRLASYPRREFFNVKPNRNAIRLSMQGQKYTVEYGPWFEKPNVRKSLPAFLLTKNIGKYLSESIPLQYYRQLVKCEQLQ